MMKFIKEKKYLLRFILVIIIIFTSLLFVMSCNISKVKVLIIQDNTSNIKYEYTLLDCTFSLGYLHSVMKTPTEEFFYANEDNQIVLEKTVYESYGVGLPFLEEEGELECVDGKFILKMNRVYDELNMIISPIPEHYICIGDKKIKLNDLLKKPNSSIKLYVDVIYKINI